MKWLWFRWVRSSDTVSEAWLKDQARQGLRNQFEGVAIKWPIRKQVNESPLWNRAKLRKRA